MVNFFVVVFGLFAAATGEISSVPDFATLCPYNDFCTSEAKLWIASTSGMESCCRKCSCASDCHLVGNCCPDMQNKTNSAPTYHCTKMNSILNAPRQMYSYTAYEPSIRVVDGCPDKSSSDNFPACENPTKLEDYIIVSNVENEKIFKNRHCAICHGEQHFTEWDLVTACPDIIESAFQSFEDRDQFVLKNCLLDARPPNRQALEMATCFYDFMLTRGCSPSDESSWNYDVIDLKKACYEKRPGQSTVYRDETNSKLYSNVYCYLCNNPHLQEAPGLCQIPVEEEDANIHVLRSEISFSSVIRIFNEIHPMDDKPCKRSEIWDSFAGICRTLHCPYGMIPVDGTCESTVVYSEGYTLFTLFEVVFLVGKPFFSRFLFHKIDSHLEGLLDSTSGCGVCHPELFQSNETIYFRKPMYTSKKCSISTLLETARSLVEMTKHTTLVCGNNEDEYRLTLKFVKEKVPFHVDKTDSYTLTDTCLGPAEQIDIQMLHNCPRLIMPVTEVFSMSSYNTVYVDPPGVISICVDKYFQMQSNAMFWQRCKLTFGAGLLIYMII